MKMILCEYYVAKDWTDQRVYIFWKTKKMANQEGYVLFNSIASKWGKQPMKY